MLRCADGWAAVTLAREWDRESVPAWLGVEGTWDAVTPAVANMSGAELADAAELFGLAIGVLGERKGGAVDITRFGDDVEPGTRRVGGGGVDGRGVGRGGVGGPGVKGRDTNAAGALRVLDLSALWAGPLCASLLAEAGADVVKVESSARPDASRSGNPGLFARLNGAKRSVVVNLESTKGRAHLAALVEAADVVVESSRPRALEQMGIVAADLLAGGGVGAVGPRVWVSITGHGRASNRAAFGDDAAVAGGLVAWDGGRPDLWGDAAADPLTGLVAATAAAEALVAGERVLLDVALAGVAAELGPTLPPDVSDLMTTTASTGPTATSVATGATDPAASTATTATSATTGATDPAPRPDGIGVAEAIPAAVRALGADTDAVLAEWVG